MYFFQYHGRSYQIISFGIRQIAKAFTGTVLISSQLPISLSQTHRLKRTALSTEIAVMKNIPYFCPFKYLQLRPAMPRTHETNIFISVVSYFLGYKKVIFEQPFFPITIIVTFSSLESTVIYATYLHNTSLLHLILL